MTDFRAICAGLVKAWDDTAGSEYEDFGRAAAYLVKEARDALAQSEPHGLTVQDCNNMQKHQFNFIGERPSGEIQLDGEFTREDLIELASTTPTNRNSD